MTPRVHHEWHNRVKAEYGSAVVTARMLQYLILIGASDELINTCMQIVRDELDHARLSHDCLVAFGGGHLTIALNAQTLPQPPPTHNILPQMLDDLIQSFLLGESFAVPLFHGMYQNATEPKAKEMLTRVLQDEATHRAFGWTVLDTLLERPDLEVRSYISNQLPDFLAQFKLAYASDQMLYPLTETEKGCGLMDGSDYRRIWRQAYAKDISKRFKDRQIDCPTLDDLDP